MQAKPIPVTQPPATVRRRSLGRDFIWIGVGLPLLALFILLGEVASLPPVMVLPVQIVRLLLGLVFVFFVPGYCLTAVLFTSRTDLDGIERAGLSLGLSVAWVPMLALILDRLPWGLRLWPIFWGEIVSVLLFMGLALWGRARLPAETVYAPQMDGWLKTWRWLDPQEKRIYLLGLTAVLCAAAIAAWIFIAPLLAAILVFIGLALWVQARQPAEMVKAPQREGWISIWRSRDPLEKRIYLLCLAALLCAAMAAAWIFLVPSPDEFMTEFYILGAEDRAESYPREALPGEPLSVTMGISNRERAQFTYRVEIWVVDPWTGERRHEGAAGPVTLDPGESHEQPLAWAMPWAGQDQIVEFYLFTGDQAEAEPYRQLRLWLNVNEP